MIYKSTTVQSSKSSDFVTVIQLITLGCFLLFSSILKAQTYTETFESITGTGKPTVFISNGQSFTAVTANPGGTKGGLLGVYLPGANWTMPSPGGGPVVNGPGGFGVGTSCSLGNCTGVSNQFLDNGLSSGKGQTYSIKTTDNHPFTIKAVFLFFSSDNGNTNAIPASLKITGKKGGTTMFSLTKTTSFITGFSVNNGFNFINFTTEGGNDNSNTSIDEIEFTCGSNINYFAIDNFTWGTVSGSLPLRLNNFRGTYIKNTIRLNWQTTDESNIDYIELQKNSNGETWEPISRQLPKGTIGSKNDYAYIDHRPKANNYYRLKMIDRDSSFRYSTIIYVKGKEENTTLLFPNPASTYVRITLQGSKNAIVHIINSHSEVMKTLSLNNDDFILNISYLPAGLYLIKIDQGGVRKTLKLLKK